MSIRNSYIFVELSNQKLIKIKLDNDELTESSTTITKKYKNLILKYLFTGFIENLSTMEGSTTINFNFQNHQDNFIYNNGKDGEDYILNFDFETGLRRIKYDYEKNFEDKVELYWDLKEENDDIGRKLFVFTNISFEHAENFVKYNNDVFESNNKFEYFIADKIGYGKEVLENIIYVVVPNLINLNELYVTKLNKFIDLQDI